MQNISTKITDTNITTEYIQQGGRQALQSVSPEEIERCLAFFDYCYHPADPRWYEYIFAVPWGLVSMLCVIMAIVIIHLDTVHDGEESWSELLQKLFKGEQE